MKVKLRVSISSPLNRVGVAAQGIDFALDFLLAEADQRQHNGQQNERDEVEHGGQVHGRIDAAAAPEDGLRMLGAPPLDRENDDGDVDESEDVEDGRDARARGWFFDGAAQHQVSGVEQPADQRGGEPRVPGPPDAPDDASPDGPGDQVGGQEGQADFGHRDGDGVVPQALGEEVRRAGDEGDTGAQHGGDGGGHVEEDDAVDHPLGGFVGKLHEDGIEIAGQEDGGDRAQAVD